MKTAIRPRRVVFFSLAAPRPGRIAVKRPFPLQGVENHQVRCLKGGIATALRIEEVGKRYGDVKALAPTSLHLRSGEVFCLIGETGSGKTTLAMIAAGFLKPDGGKRIFEDRDLDPVDRDGSSFPERKNRYHSSAPGSGGQP